MTFLVAIWKSIYKDNVKNLFNVFWLKNTETNICEHHNHDFVQKHEKNE